MENRDKIAPLGRNSDQFMPTVNKPDIILGRGITERMVLYAPEYPTHIPHDAEHITVSIAEPMSFS